MSDPADDHRDEVRRAQLAMRVGTEERERAVAELRDHFTEGRLTPDELEERTRDAFAARTVGDLARVLQDLPVRDAPLPAGPSRRGDGSPPWRGPAVPVVALVVALVVLPVVLGGAAGRGLLPLLFLTVLAVLALRLVRWDP